MLEHDSYLVKVDGSGRLTRRNRQFLHKFVPASPSIQGPCSSQTTPQIVPAVSRPNTVPAASRPNIRNERVKNATPVVVTDVVEP